VIDIPAAQPEQAPSCSACRSGTLVTLVTSRADLPQQASSCTALTCPGAARPLPVADRCLELLVG